MDHGRVKWLSVTVVGNAVLGASAKVVYGGPRYARELLKVQLEMGA